MKIADILDYLEQSKIKWNFNGCAETEVDTFCPLNALKENSLTWVRHAEDAPVNLLNRTPRIVLMAEKDAVFAGLNVPVIRVENVHRSYFQVIAHFFAEENPENHDCRIEPTATVLTEAIGDKCYIGHHTYIGKDVSIGERVAILHNVTIEGKVSIGDDTVIESGTTIGACGFGHYRDDDGNPVCVPHLGGVVIGAHVKIGANNAISRGCLSDTIIEDYVKTDNLVHIAHNDHIKRGAMLTAGVVISGSTTVGNNVWMSPGTVLNNAITVGDNSFLGLGTVAIKDVPENKVMIGVPAKVLREV